MGISREEIAQLPQNPQTVANHTWAAGDRLTLRPKVVGKFQRLYPHVAVDTELTVEAVYKPSEYRTILVVPGIGSARPSQVK